MIPYEQALKIALEEIEQSNAHLQKRQQLERKNTAKKDQTDSTIDKIILLEEETIEKEFGWVFSYTSKGLMDYYTNNPMTKQLCGFEVGGNAPFIVDRFTSAIQYTGTGEALEYYIEAYERDRQYWALHLAKEILQKTGNLLPLKRTLQLSNTELMKLKRTNEANIVLHKGGKKELNTLKKLLATLNIETSVVWNDKNRF